MNRSAGHSAPVRAAARLQRHAREFLWAALGSHITNGLAVGFGLITIALAIYFLDGLAAASAAGVGALVTTLPDLPAQKHHKFQQMAPAPALGLPLFLAMQLSHHDPVQQGMVLVFGSFVSFMGVAWGKRGGPIAIGMAFSMLFAMATPPASGTLDALERAGWYAAGAGLYLVYGVAMGAVLNRRYRKQLLAEALLAFAGALRTQAQRFTENADEQTLLADMLRSQAALADSLQGVRDVVLESPSTRPRAQSAATLLALLEARDHLIACELDLESLARRKGEAAALPHVYDALMGYAEQVETLATDMLLGRVARGAHELRIALGRLYSTLLPDTPDDAASEARIVRHVTERVAAIGDEVERMFALQRGDLAPEIASVRENWQLFISPTVWSWKPLQSQSGWYAPTLRHALRVAAAVGTGYLVSLHLPWTTHGYWILVTIIVVMRTNLAQTLERRNARIMGTLLGCGVVMAVLGADPDPAAILATVALATAIAHAFAIRRYLITSIAATTTGLLQAHLLVANSHTNFALVERLADTVLGAVIAWLFCYVLPVWERNQLPGLVRRTLVAQARHVRLALVPGDTQSPDIDWRLARREAYDSLSALVQATARTLAEPASVRPPLEPLETLQALSYRMLARLTAVKSALQLRRGQLDMAVVGPALDRAAESIDQALSLSEAAIAAAGAGSLAATRATNDTQAVGPEAPVADDAAPTLLPKGSLRPPDPLAPDLTPWLLERLALAETTAQRMRQVALRAAA